MDMESKLSSLSNVEQGIQSLDAKKREIDGEIARAKEELVKSEAAVKENKDLLANYVLNNKAATVAVAATTAGIAGVLSESLTEQERGGTILAGLAGGGYCVFNSDECTDAAAKIGYYGTQIAYFKGESQKFSNRISEAQTRLAETDGKKSPLLAERAKISTNIDALRTQIEALKDPITPAMIVVVGLLLASVFGYLGFRYYHRMPHPGKLPSSEGGYEGKRKTNARVRGVEGPFSGNKFPLDADLVFGRDAQTCTVVFHTKYDGIGRRHCSLRFDPQAEVFHLRDLGATNGTFANGRKMMPSETVTLRNGDEFYLFRPEYRFVVEVFYN